MKFSLSSHVTLLLLAASVGLSACTKESAGEPIADQSEKPLQVRTLVLETRRAVELASLPADLLPLRRAVLAAESAGTVESVRVKLGDSVTAGELLATVDERSLEQAVAEAEALLRQARLQLERTQNLFERRAVTKANLLDATTAHDVAQARLASSRLMLERARLQAPWSGRVAARLVEPGSYVAPGTPLLELVDDRTIVVRALAPESDVPYLERGREVEVQVEAIEQTLKGRIARLGAALDPASRTLAVEVELDNRSGRLVPGMVARMILPRRVLEAALLVPISSVVDLGDRRGVWIVVDGRAVLKPVRLLSRIGEEVVVEGLEPGTRIIVEGQQRVGPGQRVEEA